MPLRVARRSVLAGLAMMPALARAQAWPARPIRLVITFAPGASADMFGRTLAPRLEARLGQPVVVENRPGAGGNIGVDAVAKAAPDGYTLGVGATGALAVNPVLQPNMPYDVQRDLAPIAHTLDIPFALVAHGSQPGTVRELIAKAKAQPQSFAMAHGGNGTAMHLSAELFLQMTGLQMPAVPFRGSAPAATAVMAGDAAIGVVDIPACQALVDAGRMKALAVTTARRVSVLPSVPTMQEAGLPGYESAGWFGMIAPAGTPAPIIARLADVLKEEIAEPEFGRRMIAGGMVPRFLPPEEFAAFIQRERAKNAEVIRRANIKAE